MPTNREIADIAIKAVLEYETKKGRNPESVDNKRGLGYDIKSDDRKIEVKGTSWTWNKNKSSFQYVSENERKEATHLYLVCNVTVNPELHIFEMNDETVQKALKQEVRYMLYFKQCRDVESKESLQLHEKSH